MSEPKHTCRGIVYSCAACEGATLAQLREENARLVGERDRVQQELRDEQAIAAEAYERAEKAEAENARLAEEKRQVRAALGEVMALIEAGELVRNTERDGGSAYAMRAIRLVETLARAARIVAPTEAT